MSGFRELSVWLCSQLQINQLKISKNGQPYHGNIRHARHIPRNSQQTRGGVFIQCCINAGPPSSTLAQHWYSIGKMPRVCWDCSGMWVVSLPLMYGHIKIMWAAMLTSLANKFIHSLEEHSELFKLQKELHNAIKNRDKTNFTLSCWFGGQPFYLSYYW